ncbi:MAG: ribosome recycling factor [Patescibacteria group bacterium]|nr:ribosome recycling factor [Patescibacteria group bacterium]
MDIVKNLEIKLKSLLEFIKNEFQTIRGSRPSPRMIEDIKVEYFGQMTPIKALGSISIVPPREINVSLWDGSMVSAVAKAIEESSLKVTANVDGNTIRMNLPSLTEERRKELEKIIKKITEETKIRIRGSRDEANREIKRMEDEKKFSEDMAFKKKEDVQKVIDKYNGEIDKILDNKLKEILE